jgi:hypothetical protein
MGTCLSNCCLAVGEHITVDNKTLKCSYPYNRPWRPIGPRDVEVSIFCRIGSQMAGSLAIRASHPLPPVFISVKGLVDSRTIVLLERLGELKNSMISFGILTHNLPACNHSASRYHMPLYTDCTSVNESYQDKPAASSQTSSP